MESTDLFWRQKEIHRLGLPLDAKVKHQLRHRVPRGTRTTSPRNSWAPLQVLISTSVQWLQESRQPSKHSVMEAENHNATEGLSPKSWRQQLMLFASWHQSMLRRNSLCATDLQAPWEPIPSSCQRGKHWVLQNQLGQLVLTSCPVAMSIAV